MMSFFKKNLKLPPDLLRLIDSVLSTLRKDRNQSVSGTSGGPDLQITTQQAGDMLLVSRSEVEQMLDDEVIPFRQVGEERYIRLKDLEAYRKRRQADRKARLEELEKQVRSWEK